MKILAIDTACDETSAAVTKDVNILSSVIWSQASLHTKWGGVLPSLAQREHLKRIDWVVDQALKRAVLKMADINAVAVTVGPCLAVAGQVGIKKAKELSFQYHKPLIAVNHLEGHILSPLARPTNSRLPTLNTKFPAFGLVVSGGHTDFVNIVKIGQYEILATTQDDALGEALDKAARMLGLGYPGGAILEKMAKSGNADTYPLPLPMTGREKEGRFSYSGLKTAMWKIVESEKKKGNGFLSKKQIENLAASFQNKAFEHLIRVISTSINHHPIRITQLLVGGGVSNNVEVRNRLRKMAKKLGVRVFLPYTKKLCGDNAAMIGVAAYFKAKRGEYEKDISKVDRIPRFSLEEKLPW
jgi:N6-L-threonylcarbamoyladenine synthase